MNIRRLWGLVALGALVVGATAAPAHAKPMEPNTVADMCGPGYVVVRSEQVVRFDDTLPAGVVHIEYNPFTRSFCGFAIKSRWVGVATDMHVATVGADMETTPVNSVSGPSFHAIGPSRRQAWEDSGKNCVLFGARITDPQGNQYFHQSANPAIGFTRLCV